MPDKDRPTFVNIGSDDATPILMNTDDLVVVYQNKDAYSFYTTSGLCMNAVTADMLKKNPELEGKKYDLLADDWLELIEEAGASLLELHQAWLPGSEEEYLSVSYINPAKVAYVTASDPRKENDQEVYCNVGLEHHTQCIESHGTLIGDVESFIEAVEKSKGKKFTRIDADEAYADFYQQGYAVFDPDMIMAISGNGPSQVILDVEGSGYPLGFNIVAVKSNQITQQLIANDPSLIDDFDRLCSLLYPEQDRLLEEAHTALSEKIAALCPHLTEIPGGNQRFYTCLDDVESIRYHEFKNSGAALNIVYNKRASSGSIRKQHRVDFKDAAKGLKIFNQMAGLPRPKAEKLHKNLRAYRPKKP